MRPQPLRNFVHCPGARHVWPFEELLITSLFETALFCPSRIFQVLSSCLLPLPIFCPGSPPRGYENSSNVGRDAASLAGQRHDPSTWTRRGLSRVPPARRPDLVVLGSALQMVRLHLRLVMGYGSPSATKDLILVDLVVTVLSICFRSNLALADRLQTRASQRLRESL